MISDLPPVVIHALKIVLILACGYLGTRLIRRWFPRLRQRLVQLMIENGPLEKFSSQEENAIHRRSETLGLAIRKTLIVLVWCVVGVTVLGHIGIDVAPILTGAGVVGVALGFGARAMVQDLLAGLFLLIENRIGVGDLAQVNGVPGKIMAVRLRTTILIDTNGDTHVFQNGNVKSLVRMKNQSKED